MVVVELGGTNGRGLTVPVESFAWVGGAEGSDGKCGIFVPVVFAGSSSESGSMGLNSAAMSYSFPKVESWSSSDTSLPSTSMTGGGSRCKSPSVFASFSFSFISKFWFCLDCVGGSSASWGLPWSKLVVLLHGY